MAARPYQGYPYTNPHVTDAPSVDAATASRWNDLPRRPIQPPTQAISVIYVDVPEEGSEVSTPNVTGKKSDPEPDPVIYIDVPESGDSDVAGPASPEPEPEYVQDTIFYDPFENRRIDRQKSSDTPDTDSDAGSSRPARPPHPARPDTLDLPGASGSSGYASSTYNSIPDFLSKEASIYGRDDGFILSPLPLSSMQHPEPPPAYSEIHTPVIHTPQTTEETPSTPAEPPRTIVITQGSELIHCEPSVGLPSPYRKVLLCQHCGRNVNTLVIWQTGFMTHVVAIILLVCVVRIKPRGLHRPPESQSETIVLPALWAQSPYVGYTGDWDYDSRYSLHPLYFHVVALRGVSILHQRVQIQEPLLPQLQQEDWPRDAHPVRDHDIRVYRLGYQNRHLTLGLEILVLESICHKK